jgi:prevent-host-death family protein
MKIAPLAQVKNKLSAYVNESRDSPVIITKNGRPVALLTGIDENDDLDSLLLAHNPRFLEILKEARIRVLKTGGIKHKDFWKQMAKRRQAVQK